MSWHVFTFTGTAGSAAAVKCRTEENTDAAVLDDLKPTEVAGRLGCTVRNVTKHRLKALDKMRQLLAH